MDWAVRRLRLFTSATKGHEFIRSVKSGLSLMPFENSSGSPVPEGHSTIAQRFNAGCHGKRICESRRDDRKPRLKSKFQPSLRDWIPSRPHNPALKRRAILECPSGTSSAEFPKAITAIRNDAEEWGARPPPSAVGRALATCCACERVTIWCGRTRLMFGARRAERQPRRLRFPLLCIVPD